MSVLEILDRALEEIDAADPGTGYNDAARDRLHIALAGVKAHVLAAREAAEKDRGELHKAESFMDDAIDQRHKSEARVKVLEEDRDSQQRVAMDAMARVKVLERALNILREGLPIRPGECPTPQPAKCNPLDGCGPCYVAEAIRRAEEYKP